MNRTALALVALALVAGCDSDDSGESAGEVFFGDLHAHSAFSEPDIVGDATPEDFYRVARDDIRLDFVALSDHDAFLTKEEWEGIQSTATRFDAPGAFVTFSALEWTHRWHMNTIYRRDDEAICDCIESAQYYDYHRDMIEAHDAAAHLNHPSGIFQPIWSEIDDTISKNVEVFNASAGDQENAFGGAIWSLRAGFRFGFVGVSDDHMTDLVPPRIGNGLTGCHAGDLSRESILDALHARRCYAVTRERILVDTEVDGVAMGGALVAEIGATVRARVDATLTALPGAIVLVQNGTAVAEQACGSLDCELATDIRVEDPNNFVYARIAQPDGQAAWSSPVWIDGVCPDGDSGCLESRLTPGGGDDETDCLAELLNTSDGTPDIDGGDSVEIRCKDGDPTCDLDPTEGDCAIALGLCFRGTDSRLPNCAAARADRFEVVEPAADAPRMSFDRQNRITLEAMFRAAHTSDDKNRCSGLSGLRVRAGERRTLRYSTVSSGRVDDDTVVLECVP